MEKTLDWLRAAVYGGGSAALTGLAWLLGGWDEMLQILIILIVVDYLAALLEAWNSHSLSSTVGWHGIAKKAGYLLVVLVAHFVDRLTCSGVPFVRTVVIGILAVNECLSVVEHAGALGVPVPKALIERIEKLRAATGNGE